MSFTQLQASEALGLSKPTVELYERGARREDERPVLIPKTVELACAAVALGIKGYNGPEA